MARIMIRKLEERVKAKLRMRAAHHGRSMEQEMREILKHAPIVEEQRAQNLADAIRRQIEPLGGVELSLPTRSHLHAVVK
ncbi:MAG: hypothetical protein JO211_12470 [Acidobacteriaceae bacterium]|nr:hypothetical protein [Acidobacteriaceae bacterium]